MTTEAFFAQYIESEFENRQNYIYKNHLYNNYAELYDEIYNVLFDYEADYYLYDGLMQLMKRRKILEIGCGSGRLAKFFINGGYEYTGLDYSCEMIKLAKKRNEDVDFICSDMRRFSLDELFNVVVITGKSICHLEKSEDVTDTFANIHRSLENDGLLILDVFDSDVIFNNFQYESEHNVVVDNKRYLIKNKNSILNKDECTWVWGAQYYIENNKKIEKLFEDTIFIKSYYDNEIKELLTIANFRDISVMSEGYKLIISARK